jgi:uncharacterized DUF497 family protein
VNFEWDEGKNRKNIRKHGLSFDDAYEVFRTLLPSEFDLRGHYGEERWTGIGLLGNRIVVVTFTHPDEDTIRIISLRKALKHERKTFEEEI